MTSVNICRRGRALSIAVGITMLVLLLAEGAGAAPVEQWNRTFGGTGQDEASSVQQTSDGGYIFAGYTYSYGFGGMDAWLIKVDSNGIEQWNKAFGGINGDRANSVQQTSDGGYIIAGETSSFGNGSSDAWLIKTDANGIEQWNKTFGGISGDRAKSVQQTSDGGYIIGADGGYSALLIKTDANGIEQWNKTFGGGWYTDFVQQTFDSGYILARHGSNSLLIKTDVNGNEQWNKTFEPSIWVIGAQQTSDGGYIISISSFNVSLIKADSNGNEQWYKTFGGSDFGANSVQQTLDGGYIIGNTTLKYGGGGSGNGDAWLLKIDANGIEQWNKTFGGTSKEFVNGFRQTSDGGYILAGYTYSYGAGNGDVWLIKLSNGSRTITVNASGGADYTRIQDAINNASYGDTIEIQNGIYYENVNVDKQLILIGIGLPIVDANRNGNAITLSANGIVIDGIIITNASAFPNAGILVYSDFNEIRNNIVSNNIGSGIFFYGDSNNIINNKVIFNLMGGIHFDGSRNNTISNNNASFNGVGIYLDYLNNNNNILTGNIADSNNWYGVQILSSSNNSLIGNSITNNGISGIRIGSTGPTFYNNTIYNNYLNNTDNFNLDAAYTNYWNTTKSLGTNILGGPYFGGNFWAHPNGTGFSQTCIDANRDGICDSTYVLETNNIDYLPIADFPVHNINKSTSYFTIQSAIENASTGDEIYVDSGTYYENVNVSKQLTLRGVDTGGGMPLVDAGGAGSTITLNADGIILEGFITINATRSYPFYDVGILVNSNNNIIRNNTASNNIYGIYLPNSRFNILSYNTVNSNWNGINLTHSSDNSITSNNASMNNYVGIILYLSNNNTLTKNIYISNENAGIISYLSDNNIIYNNYFNNTNNFIPWSTDSSLWNTTKTSGLNIFGGPYLGGNFWANPEGAGFSQNCTDADRDGICDSAYILDANNADHLPLSMNFTSDITPPESVSNLRNISYALTYVNWTWIDPSDLDFYKVMIYLNGIFQINATKGMRYYNATGLTPNTIYNISTRTVDNAGNINETWKNNTATTAPLLVMTSEIHGMKFNDSNGSGTMDVGESGVSGMEILLTRMISPGVEYLAGTAFTNLSGNYNFTNLSSGFYRVEEFPGELVQTFPANGMPYFIDLKEGEIKTGIDFGNQMIIPGEIRGIKFNDSNGNGILDEGESGMSGISICIYPSWRCNITNSSGNYSFVNVSPGNYTVSGNLSSEYVATTPMMVNIVVNSDEIKEINFGSRLPVPPPPDINVSQQSGEQNGVPTVYRPALTVLTISRNLTNISENVVSVNLTMNWSDGTSRNSSMAEIGNTNIWAADFMAPFPGGTAQMRFEVDVAPAGQGPEDAIQIGDIIFIDPSGVIKNADNGSLISGATVTLLFEYPPGTNNFIVSPPENQMPNHNPLITGEDGKYSWLTVPGKYKVRAEMGGYTTAESDNVTVPPPVTDINISLIPIDNTSPASITNLQNISYAQTYINWTWTDPADYDFSKVMIYLNGIFQTNVTNGTQYYYATGLTSSTIYEIGTRTVDVAGNINETWVNRTDKTASVLPVHNIIKGTYHATIQSAIDEANPGDEIHVDSGTYFETLVVSKSLVVRGSDRISTIIDGSGINGMVVQVASNNVEISGFTIRNSNMMSVSGGIGLSGRSNVNITNNIIMNTKKGIRVEGGSTNIIILNNILNSNPDQGIWMDDCSYVNINNNTILLSANGIVLYTPCTDNNITNNFIKDNTYGILLVEAVNNVVYNNYFNNSYNIGFQGTILNNKWNTSRRSGTNIISGLNIGGNFWANPSGTGFSQTCTDANRDSICDSNYTLTSGNVDYLPLATIPPGYGYISGTVLNGTGVTDAIVSTNTNKITTTDASGIYALLVPAGMYNLTVTKEPEYYSNTSVVVTAISGTTILQDIELIRKPTGNITGRVQVNSV